MPYKPETRKTPEARKKINAAYRRWYEKSKALDTDAWKRRQEQARLRAHRYKQQRAAYRKRMWAEDPERGLAYGRKHKLKKLEAKAGRKKPIQCDVCGNSQAAIHFDHCHQTGAFRGWICFHCNAVLGHVRDDPSHLRKLIAYLEHTTAPD